MTHEFENLDIIEIEQEILSTKDEAELFQVEKKYLSKEDGVLSKRLSSLGKMNPEQRKLMGRMLNNLKVQLDEALEKKRKFLIDQKILTKMNSGRIDVSAPANFNLYCEQPGYIHLLNKTIQELWQILDSEEFMVFEGQDIEDDMHNFTYLNTPENHPARSMQDSIYIDKNTISNEIKNDTNIFHSDEFLLRTHTSPQQIRISKKILQHVKKNFKKDTSFDSSQLNFKFASIGRTYRNDSDSTHSPMFHQMEVVAIGKHIYVRDLMSMLAKLMKKFFANDDLQIRIRPSYFPFTQPSWEVDLFLPQTNSWVEVLGSGMIHPKVLSNMGLNDKTIRGYAFGAGIERLCMLKYGINDLRSLYGNDPIWLSKQAMKASI